MGPPAASTITGGLRKFCRELDHVGAKINTKALNLTKAFTVPLINDLLIISDGKNILEIASGHDAQTAILRVVCVLKLV